MKCKGRSLVSYKTWNRYGTKCTNTEPNWIVMYYIQHFKRDFTGIMV